ncbi:MAG: glycosyltransferase family 87 protein [Anaerolineae bacterium]
MNPPTLLPLFSVLARLELETGYRVLQILSLFTIVGALIYLHRTSSDSSFLRSLWFISVSPVWYSIVLGQIYAFLLFLVIVVSHLTRRRRWRAAGIFMGILVACKPNFAVWPATLLLAGYWQVALAAGLAAGLCVAVTALVYGPAIYVDWLAITKEYSVLITHCTNVSFHGIAANMGLPLAGWILSVAALCACALWALVTRPEAEQIAAPAIAISILAAPLGWVSYTLFLLPTMATKQWSWRMRIAATILLVPFIFHPILCRWTLFVDLLLATPLFMVVCDSLLTSKKGYQA